MEPCTVGQYRKIYERQEAARLPWGAWERVLTNGATGEVLRAAYEFLRNFEGCYCRADAILCRLDECREPPQQWSKISWEEGGAPALMWFPLGRHVNIYLPRADPPS